MRTTLIAAWKASLTPLTSVHRRWWRSQRDGSTIKGDACLKYITIYGNGMSVKAKVVDECDSGHHGV
jgi:hypothetical protein